jgi:hypothetical protein
LDLPFLAIRVTSLPDPAVNKVLTMRQRIIDSYRLSTTL